MRSAGRPKKHKLRFKNANSVELGLDATSVVGSPCRYKAQHFDSCSYSWMMFGVGVREWMLLVAEVGALCFRALGG